MSRTHRTLLLTLTLIVVVSTGASVADEQPAQTPAPSAAVEPTAEPTIEPVVAPTIEPTVDLTVDLSAEPTVEPAAKPTAGSAFDPQGDEWRIVLVGDLPEAIRNGLDPELLATKNFKLGFRFRHVSVFGLPIWTEDGHYCVYSDTMVLPLHDLQARTLLDLSDVPSRPPMIYAYPPGRIIGLGGLLILMILLLIGLRRSRTKAGITTGSDREQ